MSKVNLEQTLPVGSVEQASTQIPQQLSEAEKAQKTAERARRMYEDCCKKLKAELMRTGVSDPKNADAPLAMIPNFPAGYYDKCLKAGISSVKELILCKTKRLRRILGGDAHVRRVNKIITKMDLGMTRAMRKNQFEKLITTWLPTPAAQ